MQRDTRPVPFAGAQLRVDETDRRYDTGDNRGVDSDVAIIHTDHQNDNGDHPWFGQYTLPSPDLASPPSSGPPTPASPWTPDFPPIPAAEIWQLSDGEEEDDTPTYETVAEAQALPPPTEEESPPSNQMDTNTSEDDLDVLNSYIVQVLADMASQKADTCPRSE